MHRDTYTTTQHNQIQIIIYTAIIQKNNCNIHISPVFLSL